MQERELMKAGILGANEQDVKQLGGRPRFIKPQNTMNTDNTNNSSLSNNPTNNNNNNSNTNTNSIANNSTSTNTNNQPPALRCPRCESANTKFCYYNNYSLLQPRYFCKSCRRYWTKGGALRNVPVGGGCRKNKRITSRQRVGGTSDLISSSSSSSFLSHPHLDHHPSPFSPFGDHALNTRPPPPLSLLNHPHDHPPPPNLLYFNLPPNDPLMKDNHLLNQSLMPPPQMPAGHHELHPPSHGAAAGLFSRQLASYLPSSIASQYLSNVGSLPLHNFQGFNHDYLSANHPPPGADHQQLMQHSSFNTSMNLATSQVAAASATPAGSAGHDQNNMGFKTFSLPFDNLNIAADDHQHWATNKIIPHEQKLLTDQKLNQMSNPAMENQANMEGPSRLYTQLRPHTMQHSPKVEDQGWPPAPQHDQAPASASNVAAGDQAAHYWNSGGWNDMSGYNPGADHPFM